MSNTVILVAVDPDCDGPSTTLWRVTIPPFQFAGLDTDEIHRTAYGLLNESYHPFDETYLISDPKELAFIRANVEFRDFRPHGGNYDYASDKGDIFASFRRL